MENPRPELVTIWIPRELRRAIKRAAADAELSMQQWLAFVVEAAANGEHSVVTTSHETPA
jgi:hypothetical protein